MFFKRKKRGTGNREKKRREIWRRNGNTVQRRGRGEEGSEVDYVTWEEEGVGNFQKRGTKNIRYLAERWSIGVREEEGTIGRQWLGRRSELKWKAEIKGSI